MENNFKSGFVANHRKTERWKIYTDEPSHRTEDCDHIQ